jgi:uncharacterized protein YbbC (DUF1343 family)
MPRIAFSPGITTLLDTHAGWLRNRRIALLSHPAAVDAAGTSSAQCLLDRGVRLVSLMGPEHGFLGAALAGEKVCSTRHPVWKIPVHSLYGATRRPTPRMLAGVDTIVFDLQDLGARMYTYVSTLRLLLEAAAEAGKAVIVADRPIPLPTQCDGPLTEPAFESFVAAMPIPMFHGMTPGEAARWIRSHYALNVDLKVAPLRGYRREPKRQPDWPPWIPPSPGIVSWESANCYSALVFLEAFGAIDHGRPAGLPFQLFGADWIRGDKLCEELNARRLPGARFHTHIYSLQSRRIRGARLTVTDARAFQPILTSLHIVQALQQLCGVEALWRSPQVRPEFFDKLYGTDQVRLALQRGDDPETVRRAWAPALASFRKTREAALLYLPA